jgi:hypothetical protein
MTFSFRRSLRRPAPHAMPVIGAITCATLLLACAPPAASDGLDLIWSGRYTRESLETAVPLRDVPGLPADEIVKTVDGFFVGAVTDDQMNYKLPAVAVMWIDMPMASEPVRPLGPIREASLCRVPLSDGRLSFLTETRTVAHEWIGLGAFAIPVEDLRRSAAWTVRTLPVNSQSFDPGLRDATSPLELDAAKAAWTVNRSGEWGVLTQDGAVHLVDVSQSTICESLVPSGNYFGAWFSNEGTVLVLVFHDWTSDEDVSTIALVFDYSRTPLELLGEIRIRGQHSFARISHDGLSVAMQAYASDEVRVWRVEGGAPHLSDTVRGSAWPLNVLWRSGRQDRFALVQDGSVAILEIARAGFTEISRTHFSNLPVPARITSVSPNGKHLLVLNRETRQRDLYGEKGLLQAGLTPDPKPTDPASVSHHVYFLGDVVGPTYIVGYTSSRSGSGTIDLYLVR